MMRNLYIVLVWSLILTFHSVFSFAAEVTKVKGGSALIDLKGDSASAGDQFFALSSDGKKRGILQITKVKGDKAIAKITKGKAEAGMTLQARSGGGGNASKGRSKHTAQPTGRSYWGGVLGLAMDSMKVRVTNPITKVAADAALSGTSFSAKGLFDYELFPQIWFRGLGGLESFSARGSSICGTSGTDACNASIYYIAADFLGRYVFSEGNYRPWLGGGMSLMFPASKSASALDSGSISNTSVILISGGLDWFLSPTMYIPISIEYGLLPKSNEVEASWIEVRAGLAVPF